MKTEVFRGTYEESGQPVDVYIYTPKIDASSQDGRATIRGLATAKDEYGNPLNHDGQNTQEETRFKVVHSGAVILVRLPKR